MEWKRVERNGDEKILCCSNVITHARLPDDQHLTPCSSLARPPCLHAALPLKSLPSLRQSFRALSLEAWSPVAGTETKTACQHQSLAPSLTPASAHCIDTGQPAYPTFLALCRSACQCVNTILELLNNTVPVSSSCTRFPLLFFLAVGGGTNGGSSSAKRQLPCIGGQAESRQLVTQTEATQLGTVA